MRYKILDILPEPKSNIFCLQAVSIVLEGPWSSWKEMIAAGSLLEGYSRVNELVDDN